jgi:hypothetical protein
LAFGVVQQWAEMQCSEPLFDIEVHHHRGALTVWPAARLEVPAGLDQPQERIDGGR